MENKQKILLIIVIIVLTIVILYKFGKPKERFQSTNFDLNEVYLKGVQGSSGVKGNNGPKGDAGPACKNIVDFLENKGHLSLGEFSEEINKNFQLELKGKPLNPNINFAKLKITDYEDQTCYPIMVGENESDAKFYLKNINIKSSNKLKLFLQGDMEVEGEITIKKASGEFKTITITHSDLAPVGIIAAFGSGDIPERWAVCNGQLKDNGFQTPDLRNKFIKGAEASDDIGTTNEREFDEEFRFKNGDIKLKVENMPEHNHDYTCGSPNTHTMTSGSPNTHTMESGKDHTHDFTIYGGNTPLPPGVEIEDNHKTFLLAESSGDTKSLKTSDANVAHTHNYDTSNVNPITIEPVGDSIPFNVMPPYYTLLYIIKYK